MTAVVFSATDAVALLVTVGVSLTLVTVTARAWLFLVLATPSGDLHGDVIDVVGIGVGGRLVVRRADETQGAGGAIDAEKGHIGAAAEAVGGAGAGIGIGGGDGGEAARGAFLSATLSEALAPPPLLVMTGALSLTSVTLTATAWVAVKLPVRRPAR